MILPTNNVQSIAIAIGGKTAKGCDFNFTKSGEQDKAPEKIMLAGVVPPFVRLIAASIYTVGGTDGECQITFSQVGYNSDVLVKGIPSDEIYCSGGQAHSIQPLLNIHTDVGRGNLYAELQPQGDAVWAGLTEGKWILLISFINYSDAMSPFWK